DRTDAGAPAAERSWLPGHRRQHAGFNNCVEGVALTMFAVVYARTRLGGAEQTEPMQGRRRPSAAGYRVIADSTPVSTTALRGLMASLALPSASPWTAMGMRDRPAGCASCATRLCGALCGGGRPPRGGRRRWFVGGDRTMLAAPRIGAARRRPMRSSGAINMTLAATRRHRCRPGMVTADCAWFARALNRWWRLAALNDQQKMVALTMFAVVYARTRLGGAEQTEPMQGRRRPSAAGYRVIADSTPVSTTALRGSVDHVRCGLRAHEARRRRADRTDAGAPAAERSWLPGHRRQHAGFNNCVEGAYGIARFAEREPVDSDGHARSTCGVRELRDAPVRRSVRRWAAAARRPTSIVCWWRSFVGGERAMLAVPRIGAAPAPACAGAG